MPDDPYTLGDLASLADVTPRTIRYYVAQGLLPSPEAAGPATRYGEGHLLRLRLIRRLQRDHLPLAEIRSRLERLADDEIPQLLDATPPPAQTASPEEALSLVHALMADSGIEPGRIRSTDAPVGETPPAARAMRRARLAFEPRFPDAYPLRPDHDTPERPATPTAPALPLVTPPTPSLPVAPGPRTQPDRSTWEHHAVTPDVEIHVRRPLDRTANKKVDHLLRIARELFTDEP